MSLVVNALHPLVPPTVFVNLVVEDCQILQIVALALQMDNAHLALAHLMFVFKLVIH